MKNLNTKEKKLYPENSLDEHSLKEISSCGFPETNSCKDNGEITYFFNYRENANSSLNNVSLNSQTFKFCYAKFLQKKSSNAKRGYCQKSIMPMTRKWSCLSVKFIS